MCITIIGQEFTYRATAHASDVFRGIDRTWLTEVNGNGAGRDFEKLPGHRFTAEVLGLVRKHLAPIG